jgi:hypothetical protein
VISRQGTRGTRTGAVTRTGRRSAPRRLEVAPVVVAMVSRARARSQRSCCRSGSAPDCEGDHGAASGCSGSMAGTRPWPDLLEPSLAGGCAASAASDTTPGALRRGQRRRVALVGANHSTTLGSGAPGSARTARWRRAGASRQVRGGGRPSWHFSVRSNRPLTGQASNRATGRRTGRRLATEAVLAPLDPLDLELLAWLTSSCRPVSAGGRSALRRSSPHGKMTSYATPVKSGRPAQLLPSGSPRCPAPTNEAAPGWTRGGNVESIQVALGVPTRSISAGAVTMVPSGPNCCQRAEPGGVGDGVGSRPPGTDSWRRC